MEEATLRAKIQAMKNLLEAKRKSGDGTATTSDSYGFTRPRRSYYQSKKYPQSTLVNRSWKRFSSPVIAVNHSHVSTGSANKVWKREDASTAMTGAAASSFKNEGGERALRTKAKNKTWKKPVKVVANKSKSMQLLRLEDGEYSKVNGGFSLIRAGVKKRSDIRHSEGSADSMPLSRSFNNSVHIGGAKYVLANGGKILKWCPPEERNMTALYRSGSKSLSTKSGAARAALFRAKVTMRRARSKHVHVARKVVKSRTVNCSFYDRFGFCKNKDACRFIHDSRRVAMCRKFLKNECNDPKCLLSHQHDEVEKQSRFALLISPLLALWPEAMRPMNKVPDCKMFLRGTCARVGCKYRHVKVSATAEVCEPFTKGYCPKGGACPLRHELSLINRKLPTTAAIGQGSSNNSATVSGTLSAPCSTSSGAASASDPLSGPGSPKKDKSELSIRPNIRFASKHSTGLPSLFDGLRRTAK